MYLLSLLYSIHINAAQTHKHYVPAQRQFLLLPVTSTACKCSAFQRFLYVPQPSWSSPTTSPWPAAYRQMHKEFNRVDLMREQRRGGWGCGVWLSMLWICSPLHLSQCQTSCIDRGQWGVVLAPWSLSWELQMGQTRAKLQLWVNDVTIYKTISLVFLMYI